MTNYIKTQYATRPGQFFPFASEAEFGAAFAAARASQPTGLLMVYKPVTPMPRDVRCVGHSPVATMRTEDHKIYWTCTNCGQKGSSDSKGFDDQPS
jgi:hypothetical protein